MAKATKAQVLIRVDAVAAILAAGRDAAATKEKIRQYAAANSWGVSWRQLQRYQAQAVKLLRDKFEWPGRTKTYFDQLARCRALCKQAVQIGDMRTAAKLFEQECQLSRSS